MTRRLRKLFEKLFGSGTLIKQVITILSGTATGQFLTVAATVPLARLYTPSDFGLFAIIQSVVAIGVTLAALRYDVAIVLPKSEVFARVLYKLASSAILITSALLSLAFLIARPFVEDHYGNSSLAIWLVACGFATYFMSEIVAVQFWLNRQQDYRAIAYNRLVQAVAVALSQILFALVWSGFQGLFAGLIVGSALTLLMIRRRTPELRVAIGQEAPTKWEVAKMYRKMPLVNGPNALLDAIKTSGINVLIGNIAVSGLGQYSLAYQMTKAPVSLLNGAVAQVLLRRLAMTGPGGMTKLLHAAFLRIFLFSAPVFGVFYFAAPSLFPILFGEHWAEAGLISQALVPWLFMLTFTSPLSSLFVVANKQEWALGFAVLSTSASLGFLGVTSLDLLPAIRWLAWIMTGVLMLWVVMALIVAHGYDRGSASENRAL